jgi:multidrug efflux pump subunit AcrA (membrane-fusion protein)
VELKAQLQAVRAEAATTALRADTLLAQKESLEARLAAGAETVAMAADSTALIRNARSEAEGLRSQNQNYQEELQALRLRVQVRPPAFSRALVLCFLCFAVCEYNFWGCGHVQEGEVYKRAT